MNAEDFYEHLKDALRFLGVSWGDKHLVAVSIVGGSVRLAYEGKECNFEV